MDRRKLLVGVGLIAFVALVGIAMYLLFFRHAPTIAPPTPPPVNGVPVNAPPGIGVSPPTPGTLPGVSVAPGTAPGTVASPTAQGGITQVAPVTETPALFSRLGTDGRLQYYDPNSGRFYRIAADGSAVALSDHQFPNVKTIAWAPGDDRAIIEFPDGANVLYDFRTNKQVTLPTHWQEFSFSPRGDLITGKSIGIDRENRFLFEASPDGNDFRALEPLGSNERKVQVAWSPNNQVIAFSRTGNDIGDGRQQILAVGRNGENFPGITIEGIDFRPQWSPTGDRVLYSDVGALNDYRPELWVVGGTGSSIGRDRIRLHVNTWADKCTFANNEILYCAVPDQLARGYGLESSLADAIPDTIERIDLRTGLHTTIGRPESDASITQLLVAPDGGSLYYASRNDGRVYEMRLR